ncbi:porin family protein [candidate division KSB1 bacterium]|nr:porin family protein [candidate division KSB1 bacterium]
MKYILRICIVLLLVSIFSLEVNAGGNRGNIGLGLRLGVIRFKSDLENPAFGPMVMGTISYNANEFISFGFESGYGILENEDDDKFQTAIVPYEVHATFSFFPLGRVNPYALFGGGGVYWNATYDGKTIRDDFSNELQEKYDSFFKFGAGLEVLLNNSRNLYLDIGATYRYSLTDMLDQDYSGNLNDAVYDFHAGLTYYFRTNRAGDRDNDGIPDELDLSPTQREDHDGYLDHDGKPEGIPPLASVQKSENFIETSEDNSPPVVIHTPLRVVESDRNIKINAEIYENNDLKIAALLYRPQNFYRWNVIRLNNIEGVLYEGIIPKDEVREQGIEYCVIAVDRAVSGIGYSGLPKRPNRVKVIGNTTFWRIVNGVAALTTWGTAGYLISKEQN